MKSKKIFFALTFILVGLVAGLVLSSRLDIFSSAQSQNAPAVSLEGYKMEDAVINVARTAGQAVVSISSEHTAKLGGRGTNKRLYFNAPFGQSPFGQDEFRKFFDDFFGQMPEREFKQIGLGSGVIFDKQGYVLTNEHVVSDADKITVTLPDGREFKGEVKGKDKRSDLAVIKINATNLPVASLGDSDSSKIGQWVVAIGNPFGFAMQNPEPTVTVGVISALHRALGKAFPRERDYNDLIQTDAAINPGNSGGPLVNLKGEVIGINVAIFSTTGGYQGVGFAIPINSAKRIIALLIEGKKISYGWVGVTVQNLTDDLAKYFGLTDKSGVLVAKVLENGPAMKAGIKEGDVIKQFDNASIANVKELLNLVGRAEVGKKIKVILVRDKKELTLDLQVGERPENLEGTGEEQAPFVPGAWRGLQTEDITPELAMRFRIAEKKGVVVVDVEPNSAADNAGINPGDIILEINKQEVKNSSDYEKATKGVKGDALVKTQRGFLLIKQSEK